MREKVELKLPLLLKKQSSSKPSGMLGKRTRSHCLENFGQASQESI
jgi:hypothetical protein